MHDFRYAARLLARQPRFTLLAALTMALGIGAATMLFSVTYGVLLKPLPWPADDRVVVLKETRGGNPPRFGSREKGKSHAPERPPHHILTL